MPINLKHSGNAAPALVGAYAGGEGERGAHDAPVLSKLYGERAAQTSRQASAMMSQLKESADRRQAQFLDFARQRMSERQREIDRQGDIARADAIRAENRQNFLADRAHAEARQDALRAEELARADESARAAQPPDQFRSMGGDDSFLPQLTREEYDADREGYNRLFAQWRAVGADDGLTDDEKLAARQELSRQFYGLQTAPRPPADPTPQERFERDTFEWQGARYGFDKSGKVYQVPAAPVAGGAEPAPTFSWQAYSKLYDQLSGQTDAEGKPRFKDAAAIHKEIQSRYKLFQSFFRNSSTPLSEEDILKEMERENFEARKRVVDDDVAFWAWRANHPYSGQPYTREDAINHGVAITLGEVPPGTPLQPATSDPLAAVEAGWSASLAQEQGAPRPDSPAQPGVAPEPSPASPAPTPSPRPLVTLADGSPGIRLPDGTEVPWVPNLGALAPPPSLTPARKRR